MCDSDVSIDPPDPVDEAIDESFPASDPPSWAAGAPSQQGTSIAHPQINADSPLVGAMSWLESRQSLDASAAVISRGAKSLDNDLGDWLRGTWLGHALHPLLTDFPLGCWASAALLDIAGGRTARRSARFLVGMGLMASVPTAAAGIAEWKSLPNRATTRVGTAHALGNAAAILCYARSWVNRRREPETRAGLGWGMLGGLLCLGTGYLGGHLSFGRGTGVGIRQPDRRREGSSPAQMITPAAGDG